MQQEKKSRCEYETLYILYYIIHSKIDASTVLFTITIYYIYQFQLFLVQQGKKIKMHLKVFAMEHTFV